MRDALAERLLAKVMGWTPADVARERPILQAMALLKYDEYQQFHPGMRFVESLALWLRQSKPEQRAVAYDYICSRLVFLSEAEMAHFAAIMYPDVIRPRLLQKAAASDGTSEFRVSQIAKGEAFRRLQASTLFFGLSDGARIDQFRRSNRELSHEQIFPSYEIPAERVDELRAWLSGQDLGDARVRTIVLLDDFAGSGTSYLREEDGQLKGKLPKFLRRIASSEWKGIVDLPATSIVVALYVATTQALDTIGKGARRLEQDYGAKIDLRSVQPLDGRSRLLPSSTEPFVRLVEDHYDPVVEDEHTKKGGTNLKYGFAECGLTVVLHHNTPNNSLCLIWAEDSAMISPLFPRVSRHRRDA